jgi:hypothetical protein
MTKANKSFGVKMVNPLKKLFIKIWKNKYLAAVSAMITAIGTIIALLTYAHNIGVLLKGLFFDDITISCPDEIFSYEQSLHGTYSPSKNRFISLYISPQPKNGNGKKSYWLQPAIADSGTWSLVARFGNPFWHGMEGAPPLKYEVVAALYKKPDIFLGTSSAPIDIAEGKDIVELLKKSGASVVLKRAVTRMDEIGCHFIPKIICPSPPSNPREEPQVLSPIKIRWEPNQKMWVELWKDGSEVKTYPIGMYDNSFSAKLETGLYELKMYPFGCPMSSVC